MIFSIDVKEGLIFFPIMIPQVLKLMTEDNVSCQNSMYVCRSDLGYFVPFHSLDYLSLWEIPLKLMLPQNWVRLLVDVEPKDTTKPKIGRRKDLLLAASKGNTADLSQSSVSPNSKIGDV